MNKTKLNLKFYGILPAMASIIIFGIATILFNLSVGFITIGIVVIMYAMFMLYAYFRTRHFMSLVSTIYMILLGAVYISLYDLDVFAHNPSLSTTSKLLILLLFVFLAWMFTAMLMKKYKWRGREILELAAKNISENPGSFTNRPQPIGKVAYLKEDLEEFSHFFEKNLLGLTYKESDKIVFMPLKYRNEFFALYNPNYNYYNKTWISIDFDGNVSVNISQDDYLDYKNDLDFDQLCKGFSDVMISFIDMYLSGEEIRIIDKMNSLNISIFS